MGDYKACNRCGTIASELMDERKNRVGRWTHVWWCHRCGHEELEDMGLDAIYVSPDAPAITNRTPMNVQVKTEWWSHREQRVWVWTPEYEIDIERWYAYYETGEYRAVLTTPDGNVTYYGYGFTVYAAVRRVMCNYRSVSDAPF